MEVVDTGAGIAIEDQAKVFGQFAQFNRNELQKGGDHHLKGALTNIHTYIHMLVSKFIMLTGWLRRRLWLRAVDFAQDH